LAGPIDALILVDWPTRDRPWPTVWRSERAPTLLLVRPGWEGLPHVAAIPAPRFVEPLPADVASIRRRIPHLLALSEWERSAEAGALRAAPDGALRGANVLWAEDDAGARAWLESQWRSRFGITPTFAKDGAEACRLLLERPGAYDLFVTDEVMPRLNGSEVIARVGPLLQGVTPIVFEDNGYQASFEVARFTSAGIHGFDCWQRPQEIEALRACLYLRRAWQRARGIEPWPL
jgi:CheY-like chemotaxis protein